MCFPTKSAPPAYNKENLSRLAIQTAMQHKVPAISIVMPVFNGATHLKATLDSLLAQTFKAFELIIIDDGSTDATAAIIHKIRDERVRYLQNPHNMGISYSANRGIEESRGKYMARADADDIHLPRRLEMQWKFMEAHSHVHVCGSFLAFLGNHLPVATLPEHHDEIKAGLPFYTTMAQPTSFFRLAFLHQHAIRYDCNYIASGDYDLWFRMTHNHEAIFANIQTPLVEYRTHAGSISIQKNSVQVLSAVETRKRHFLEWGIPESHIDMQAHAILCTLPKNLNLTAFEQAYAWLQTLRRQNEKHTVYAPLVWRTRLTYRLLNLMANNIHIGPKVCELFFTWPDAEIAEISPHDKKRLFTAAEQGISSVTIS